MGQNRDGKVLDETGVYVALALTPIGLGMLAQVVIAPGPAYGPFEVVGFITAGALCLTRLVTSRKRVN